MRDLFWMGSSLDTVRNFPEEVQDGIGYALYLAQLAQKHPSAKPLRDIKTSSRDVELIEARLKAAIEDDKQRTRR